MERCRSTLPRLRRSAPASLSLGGDPRHQIADMDHAARIIERLAIDRQPRMLGLAEHAHQLVDGDAVVHGDDVGARHHDVLDRELAEAEDVDAACRALARSACRSCCAPARPRSVRGDRAPRQDRTFAAGDRTRMPPRRHCRCSSAGTSSSAVGVLLIGDPSAASPRFVRIGNPERRKHGSLDRFHPLGLGVLDVIQAEQMQHAVHDEMGDVIVKRDVLRSRFLGGGLESEHDIAETARPFHLARGRGTRARWSPRPCRATCG